ncbi:hypothetical protein EVAR_37750_1 [Eumeta japonica]|uniref:Uncharacterized protein n=1 Tax=Eumeta variegata TaxID=151549 RepID=A0A4C1WMW6_EUMVA|nr:hypothetical protein EVAR_37750_1 [Eumeta japonica]
MPVAGARFNFQKPHIRSVTNGRTNIHSPKLNKWRTVKAERVYARRRYPPEERKVIQDSHLRQHAGGGAGREIRTRTCVTRDKASRRRARPQRLSARTAYGNGFMCRIYIERHSRAGAPYGRVVEKVNKVLRKSERDSRSIGFVNHN